MDMDIGEQSFDSSNSSPVPDNSAPVEQSSSERTFRQSELNDIVKRVKHEAVEDYKRISSQQPKYAEQKYGEPSRQQFSVNENQKGFSENDIRKFAAEETQRLRDHYVSETKNQHETEAAQRIVNNFWNKIAPGKEKYQDFEQVTGNIEYARFPNVVQLLSEHIDNSHDVLYELGKNRLKMSQLEQLSYMSPKDAIIEAKRLADSIKENESSGNLKSPNSPLSQLRPSHIGTDTGGAMSMSDYKRKYRG